jgi:aryl-alcohol dehydrogenase-like predicted oxidoreductase
MGKTYSDRYWLESNFEAVKRFKEITKQHGRSMAQFALAWILNNKTITSVVCGSTSIKQMEENAGAVDIKLTDDELAACDEVWNQLRPPRFFYGAQQLIR